MTWKNSICMSVGKASCPDVNDLVNAINPDDVSPIDCFYRSTSETLTKISPAFFTEYTEDVTGLLFVGLISSTENYFRDILGFLLTICPIAQAHSASEKIQLGSMLWAPENMHSRSAFEFLAFSNAKNIRNTIQAFAKHQIKPMGILDSMLEEYDKLCELRHAAVHSGHMVAGKNAIKLGIKRSKKPLRINMNFANLQAAGLVCTALVQAANNELFEMLISRWGDDWRKHPSWDKTKESQLLRKIYATFLSKRDDGNNTIANRQSLKRLAARLQVAFSL